LEKVGLKREDVVGKSLWDLHPDTEGTARLLAGLSEFRTKQRRETHVVNRAMLGMQLSLRVQPIFENDEYQGVILNAINVTDLVEARQAAEAANHSKSAFLANMSHEIRTPMTAILGFSEVLTGSVVDREQLNAATTIRQNGEYLLRLINDILDLSKIEAGKLEVEHVRCSPCQILSEVVSLMRVRASAKNLPLEIEYDGPIPQSVQSDPTRLRQILINLTGNAIKFTEVGEVRLAARLLDAESDKPKMQFEVADSGIGMTEEQIAQLFVPFSQVDTSASRKHGGTGLGLAISKRLAGRLGGDITVKSTPGWGSTFTVTVATGPLDGVKLLDKLTEAQLPIDSDEKPDTSRARLDCRVLLAEDGLDNQRLIAFMLKKAGAEVVVADNGQIACALALAAWDAETPFDVILMDMQMPVMDGYVAAAKLRQAGYTGPIIALTAHAMSTDRDKCLDAGCDDYLAKPVDCENLTSLVARHTSGQPKWDRNPHTPMISGSYSP
ncbi:MAG: ATP-binding protein, partial [Planctomycetota bacterium]